MFSTRHPIPLNDAQTIHVDHSSLKFFQFSVSVSRHPRILVLHPASSPFITITSPNIPSLSKIHHLPKSSHPHSLVKAMTPQLTISALIRCVITTTSFITQKSWDTHSSPLLITYTPPPYLLMQMRIPAIMSGYPALKLLNSLFTVKPIHLSDARLSLSSVTACSPSCWR